MENRDAALAKHIDYPVTNVFGDSGSKTSQVEVEIKDEENDKIPNPQSAAAGTTKVDMPRESTREETVVVEASINLKNRSDLDQFAIEDNDKNTVSNPTREATNCLPILVRKAHSYEILPRPFRTTNQFICVAYLSVLCCCCFGAAAAHWAWETKLQRNKGLYVAAKRSSRRALFWIVLAACFGTVFLIINLSLFLAGMYK